MGCQIFHGRDTKLDRKKNPYAKEIILFFEIFKVKNLQNLSEKHVSKTINYLLGHFFDNLPIIILFLFLP